MIELDHDLIRLSTRDWQVLAAPGHGGTLLDVRPVGVEANLLWRRPGERARRLAETVGEPGPPSIATFDRGTLIGGWFVMFPTAGQPGDDLAEPTWQHGWAPRMPWTVTATGDDGFALGLTYHDGRRTVELLRELTVRRSSLVVSTRVRHLGGEPLRYSAGEHPCFDRALFVGGALEERTSGAAVPTPIPIAPEPDGLARHRKFGPGRRMVRMSAPRLGGSVEVRSDLRYAVLWERRSEAERIDTIAWEPASAPGLGWTDADAAGAVRVLPPGGRAAWRVALRWRWDPAATPAA